MNVPLHYPFRILTHEKHIGERKGKQGQMLYSKSIFLLRQLEMTSQSHVGCIFFCPINRKVALNLNMWKNPTFAASKNLELTRHLHAFCRGALQFHNRAFVTEKILEKGIYGSILCE